MAIVLPALELKFSNVFRTQAATNVVVRLYRLDDGGLNDLGLQLYLRTLLRERLLLLDAGWDDARLLQTGQQKVTEEAQSRGLPITPDRLVCTL